MTPLVQDLIVTAVALGAAAFVVRRVVDTVRPEPPEPGCEHCGRAADRQDSPDRAEPRRPPGQPPRRRHAPGSTVSVRAA